MSKQIFFSSFFSPNTPGLRNLQAKEALETLICQVLEARNSLPVWKPVLLKIAPDLEQIDKEDIAAVIMENPKVSSTTLKMVMYHMDMVDFKSSIIHIEHPVSVFLYTRFQIESLEVRVKSIMQFSFFIGLI